MKTRGEHAILPVVARSSIFAALALAIGAMLLTPTAFAQDVTVPIPGEYGPSSGTSADEIPDPTAILNEDGSSFAIPIPGGGEIQVQGPESEAPQTLAPTENWAVQRNTPFSVGGTPMGPVPSTR